MRSFPRGVRRLVGRLHHMQSAIVKTYTGVFLVLSACGGSVATPPSDFVSYDSSGVIIAINTRAGEAELSWEVGTVPSISLGADARWPLHRIEGATTIGDTTLVVDGGRREILLFDSEGQLIRKTGGTGAGPGEYQDPVLIPWPGSSDSLLVFDKQLGRLTILGLAGDPIRTVRFDHRPPAGRRPPVGAADPHTLLFEERTIVGGEAALQRSGLRELRYTYSWYNPSTGRRIQLDSATVAWSFQGRGWESPVPHAARPSAAVTSNSALVSDGRSFEVRIYGRSGGLRRIVRLQQQRQPLQRAMLGSSESQNEDLPVPDSLPAFQSLRVDASGWLWAQFYQADADDPKEWVIIDTDGRARGLVRTPARLNVLHIGEDEIVGLYRDELDVEYVHRYELRRREAAHEQRAVQRMR